MRCAQCGFDAPAGAAFCSRCGSQLVAPRPADHREFALMRVWPSWWRFARSIVLALILAGAGIYLLFLQRSDWRYVPVLWVLAGLVFGLTFINRRCQNWSVTSERLIERRGVISTRQRQIELADIRSVEIDRRLLQKMLGIGDVLIASAASADFSIRLAGVHAPLKVAETIRQARLKRLA